MKILIVSQYFWPENFRINDLAVGLKKKGHQITVLTGIPNYPDGHFFQGYGFFKKMRQDYQGVKVIRVPLLPRGKGGNFLMVLNYFSFAFFSSILAPFFCRGKFNLIFVFQLSPVTQALPALILKKLKSIPIMFWVQDLWPESLSATGAVRSKIILKIVEKLVSFIYSRCDRILIQSRAFSPSIERLGVEYDRIQYFPNSAEEIYEPMVPEADASEQAALPNGFRVMFAGNIGAAQDFPTILKAAEKLKDYPDIHWLILGDGRIRPWVEAQIEEQGLEKTVRLLGRHPIELMPLYFSFADVMLVTLKKEYIFSLTIPAKVQSYLACARPIIAALDGEGARVVEEAGAGLTCPAGDPESLAKTVLKAYNMTADDREKMALQGRVYFEKNFESRMLLDRLDGWLSELVGRKR